MTDAALYIAALVLAIIDIIRSRGQALTSWGVLLIAVALLLAEGIL